MEKAMTSAATECEQNKEQTLMPLVAMATSSCRNNSADTRPRRIKTRRSRPALIPTPAVSQSRKTVCAEPRGRSHLSNKTPEDRVREYGHNMFRCSDRLLVCRYCDKAVDPRRRSSIEYHLKSYAHMRRVNLSKLFGTCPPKNLGDGASSMTTVEGSGAISQSAVSSPSESNGSSNGCGGDRSGGAVVGEEKVDAGVAEGSGGAQRQQLSISLRPAGSGWRIATTSVTSVTSASAYVTAACLPASTARVLATTASDSACDTASRGRTTVVPVSLAPSRLGIGLAHLSGGGVAAGNTVITPPNSQTITTPALILDATSAGPVLIRQTQPSAVVKLEPVARDSCSPPVHLPDWPVVYTSDVVQTPSSSQIMRDGTISSLCEAQLASHSDEPSENASSVGEEPEERVSCVCCCCCRTRHDVSHHHAREGKTFPNELVLKGRVSTMTSRPFMLFELPINDLTLSRLLSACSATLGVASKSVKEIIKLPNTLMARDKDVQRLLDYQEIELVLHDCTQYH